MKDIVSNDADWVRKLRIVLIAAQKAYVLNAPLSVLNLSVVCRCCETSDTHVLMTTPSHVMIGHGLVDLDHVTLR